jgi:hypothetical protein
MRGFLFGAMALIVLEVLVTNPSAQTAFGGVFGVIAQSTERLFDANVPAIGPRPATTTTGLGGTSGPLVAAPGGTTQFFAATPSTNGA